MASIHVLRPSHQPSSQALKSPFSSPKSSLQLPSLRSTTLRVPRAIRNLSPNTVRLALLPSTGILKPPDTTLLSDSIGSTRVTLRRRKPRPAPTVCMAYQPRPATDRLISAVAYFLPFLNGLSYGYELFSALPALEAAFDPIVPLLSFYKSIPYHTFIGFFVLYVGIVRDRKFSRYVRFNSLQALMLDLVSVVPSLMQLVIGYNEGLGFQLVKLTSSVIFVVIVASFLYTFSSCILGKRPYFPYATDVVDWQLSAFDRMF